MLRNSSKTEQCSRVYLAIDKKTCSTLTSLAQFSSLPFLPSYCQRLLKGNDRTHPLFFMRRDAGPCLLIGQLPAPDRQKGKWIEKKSIYISPHGLLMNKGELSFVCVKAGSNVISIYKRYIWRRSYCGCHRCLCLQGDGGVLVVIFSCTECCFKL